MGLIIRLKVSMQHCPPLPLNTRKSLGATVFLGGDEFIHVFKRLTVHHKILVDSSVVDSGVYSSRESALVEFMFYYHPRHPAQNLFAHFLCSDARKGA
jgi:hypothetical protein